MAIVTPSPTVRPVGFDDVMVMVTVLPVSLAELIALVGPPHIDASPVVHAGGCVPAGHAGIAFVVAAKASVAGLYNSAVFNATCPVGTPGPGVGGLMLKNELPVEPPTISTWPSSAVPLPEIRVALGPLRAIVIKPPLPLPASVNALVTSLYSSEVRSASHSNPFCPPMVLAEHD